MILSLCTLAMVGTVAAQNSLFSFARNKMMENHDISLNMMDDFTCSTADLKKLASGKRIGEEFDCIKKVMGVSITWHCIVTADRPYCQNSNEHLAPYLVALVSGNLVTARSKGAVVSASTEGAWNGYSFPASDGNLGGPSCWVANLGHSEWYQYLFNTTVSIVEVQT